MELIRVEFQDQYIGLPQPLSVGSVIAVMAGGGLPQRGQVLKSISNIGRRRCILRIGAIGLDSPKYKDYIFPLIFTKRLCDVFDDDRLSNLTEAVSAKRPATGAASTLAVFLFETHLETK